LEKSILGIHIADSNLASKPKGTEIWYSSEFDILKHENFTYSVWQETILKSTELVRDKLISRQKEFFLQVIRNVSLLNRYLFWRKIIRKRHLASSHPIVKVVNLNKASLSQIFCLARPPAHLIKSFFIAKNT